jgi:predicted lipoprotein with Yx(FWY)xxD motif
MASLNSLQMRSLTAQPTAIRYVDDGPIALRIKHVGTTAVTSVTVTTATNIVLIDADGTTTSTFATDTTIGAVADRINAAANWECKILDALRATLSANTLVDGAITVSTVNNEAGYSVTLDTSGADDFLIRCTYDRTAGNLLPSSGHRVKLVKFEYNLDVSAAEAGAVQIFEWDPVLKTETKIWSNASVDATLTTHDFTKGPITAKEGNDLVILVTDATSITDAAANYMQAIYVRE